MNSSRTTFIAVSGRAVKEADWAPVLLGARQPYLEAMLVSGGLPLVVPPLRDLKFLRELYYLAKGILLTGGEDINPACYHELPHQKLGQVSDDRDFAETHLVQWATEDKKPILAVCRGMQILNVSLGGTLYQDIPTQLPVSEEHNIDTDYSGWFTQPHRIKINHSSRLASLLGVEELAVNSLHHQALKLVADKLNPVAWSSGGIIEAVEATDPSHFCIGVQCHPEMLWQETDIRWRKVFAGFVEEAARF